MATLRLQGNRFAILRYRNQTANDHTSQIATAQAEGEHDYVLFDFEKLPDNYAYNEIVSLTLSSYAKNFSGTYESISRYFDELTANYYNSFDSVGWIIGDKFSAGSSYSRLNTYVSVASADSYDKKAILEVLHNGFAMGLFNLYYADSVYTPASSQKPYIEVTVSNEIATPYVSGGSPTGKIDRKKQILFNWSYGTIGYCYGSYYPQSTAFRWRTVGSSSWNTVTLGSGVTSYTAPANTFPSGTIEWKADVTFQNSQTASTGVKTIDTSEPIPSVEAVSPKNTIISRENPNVISWNYIIESGSAQYAYEIKQSSDGTTWTSLKGKTVSESTEYTVPANTIPVGDWFWRVRGYNSDNVASGWSEAQVKVIGSPDTPNIRFTDISPKLAFSWSATSQQGYQIRIDGEIVKSQYGTDSSYQYDGWLTDGSHTVDVRVQNSYGLWSAWGTATVTVQNVPETAITLTASGNSLSWTSGYEKYAVYRNDFLIAITEGTSFRDVFANGNVSYFVRGYDDGNGNYTLSNSVSVTVSYENLTIFDTETGITVDLGRSAKQTRQINVTIAKDVTFNHYSGHAFPVAERGISVDRRCNFEFAFLSSDPARSDAEGIIGHTVILLNPYGESIVGVISDIRKTEDEFICSYSATLTKTEYSEVEINARL